MFGPLLDLIAQTPTPDTVPPESSSWLASAMVVGVIVGVFVLPFLVGSLLAKQLRMPTYSSKIGFILAVIVASVLVVTFGKWRAGVDLKGGTILVYEVMESQGDAKNEEDQGNPAKASDLVNALTQRINPSGTKEIVIRSYGERQIEIIVPNVDQMEIDEIKRLLVNAGSLQFRIVANTTDHQDVLQRARALASSENPNERVSKEVRTADGELIGGWYTVGREEKPNSEGVRPFRVEVDADIVRNSRNGQLLDVPPMGRDSFAFEKWLSSVGVQEVDVLMAYAKNGKPYQIVNGDDLTVVQSTRDERGGPAVSFNMSVGGAQRMLRLTGANQPTGSMFRKMAIILDGRVLSAPRLNSPISSSGIIEGKFTKEEVEFLVSILRAGKLPAALSKQPLSENRIGSVLGVDTINKGISASLISLVATFLAMLIYYRFPGVIACLALAINILVILAVMVLIRQPFTLPGLAGLVLTVGMSVDANVLIFERIREEIAKGSAARMAIRNGFERATTTIVDANLTTLITAAVLYLIGTDQVRGFAVALFIGIIVSMFTAIYCSRVLFDIFEKTRRISLSMSDLVGALKRSFLGQADFDFMGRRQACYILSAVLIVAGIAAVAVRGKNLLDIDFSGGTSVTFVLDKPVEADRVRKLVENILDKDAAGQRIQSTLSSVGMTGTDAGSVYRLDTSLVDVEELGTRLREGFAASDAANLVTYQVKQSPQKGTGDTSFWNTRKSTIRLVSYQPPSEEAAAPTPDAAQTPAAEAVSPAQESTATSAEPATPPAETPATETSPTVENSVPAVAPPASEASAPEAANAAESAGSPQAAGPFSKLELNFGESSGDQAAKINAQQLRRQIIEAAQTIGVVLVDAQIELSPTDEDAEWSPDSLAGYASWQLGLPLDMEQSNGIVNALQVQMSQEPVWLSLSSIGAKVAKDMQGKAIAAVAISLVFIVAYIWFRFQKLAFGIAAVVALVHDVLITLGVLAASRWLAAPLGFLGVEDFKVSLTIVAAMLTIIGYSLNDTIVVFDRIREVKGKSPRLTSEMVNLSVNQTLSRTLLTSGTTLLVVIILYFLGGEGIHGFAFCLFIGIMVGTYSSIFVAAPILLWLTNSRSSAAPQNVRVG